MESPPSFFGATQSWAQPLGKIFFGGHSLGGTPLLKRRLPPKMGRHTGGENALKTHLSVPRKKLPRRKKFCAFYILYPPSWGGTTGEKLLYPSRGSPLPNIGEAPPSGGEEGAPLFQAPPQGGCLPAPFFEKPFLFTTRGENFPPQTSTLANTDTLNPSGGGPNLFSSPPTNGREPVGAPSP